jgi:hypothetical protein
MKPFLGTLTCQKRTGVTNRVAVCPIIGVYSSEDEARGAWLRYAQERWPAAEGHFDYSVGVEQLDPETVKRLAACL